MGGAVNQATEPHGMTAKVAGWTAMPAVLPSTGLF